MIRTISYVMALLALLCSQGVAGFFDISPPKCSDDETISLVREIIIDQIGGSEGLTEEEIEGSLRIEFPRASDYNEKIKKYTCEGKLIAGEIYQVPIIYASQLDDNDRHIVSVGRILRGDLKGVYAGVIEGIKRIRAEKAVEQPNTPATPVAVDNPAPTENQESENLQTSPEPTWSPSFDCSKASTFPEKAVCTDSLLGKLDGALSENYKYMLASDIGDGARNDLKATQRQWLADRNKCTDNQCLENSYRNRMDEVCDYPVITGIHPICVSSDEIQ